MTSISTVNKTNQLANNLWHSSSFVSTKKGGIDYGRTRPHLARLPFVSESLIDASHILDHLGSQSLEDMESMLEGITKASTTETVLEECYNYTQPRLHAHRNRDLTDLMIKRECQRISNAKITHHDRQCAPTRTSGCRKLSERMNQYLEEGLARILTDDVHNVSGGLRSKLRPSYDAVAKQKQFRNTKTLVSRTPIVWVIQPTVRKDKIKFKISTEFGARFLLKKEELVDFLNASKRFSRKETNISVSCGAFFQVYTIDSRESRVVQSDDVCSLVEEMSLTNGKRKYISLESSTEVNDGRNDNGLVDASKHITTITFHSQKDESENRERRRKRLSNCLVKRFSRYLNRQRFKLLIYRQTGKALVHNINADPDF
mmetsp:Transcript_13034/g.32905  ORF Transcript_13034/g.32905 Transcript_13034/m.32905 type:complete len:373 (+) Transcript_13034:474-1592(+)